MGKNDYEIDLMALIEESMDELLCEGGAAKNIEHLYQDGKLTFGEMRQILQDVFQGKTVLYEKVDGMNLLITYKDGKFGYARNKASLKEPMDLERLGSHFDGNPKLKEAFTESAKSFSNALKSRMDQLTQSQQEEMIDLQTMVNRRDVAFSTSSNVVRALGTSSMDNAQNF